MDIISLQLTQLIVACYSVHSMSLSSVYLIRLYLNGQIHVLIHCIVSTCVYICILMHISIHIFHFSLPIFLFSQPLIDFWIIHTRINRNRCELLLEIQRWHASVIMASSAAIGYAPWLISHYFIIKIYPSNCLSSTQYTNKSIVKRKYAY